MRLESTTVIDDPRAQRALAKPPSHAGNEAIDRPGAEALAGLVRVQDALIGRAGDYARDLDFETADRILDDAALVRDDPEAILALAKSVLRPVP